MNSVHLIGNLTRDPESVTGKSGTDICNLRVAIQRRGQDAGAVYTDVKTFSGQALACGEYLSKGDEVAISGRLELDEWQSPEGAKRSRLYVVGERVDFLRKKGQGGRSSRSEDESPAPAEEVAA